MSEGSKNYSGFDEKIPQIEKVLKFNVFDQKIEKEIQRIGSKDCYLFRFCLMK
jgi:hypothetical protein